MNTSFSLDDAKQLNIPEESNERVIKKVEEKFAIMPPDVAEFDHYRPAEYLILNRDSALARMPDLGGALDRFEALFEKLNSMLPAN